MSSLSRELVPEGWGISKVAGQGGGTEGLEKGVETWAVKETALWLEDHYEV